MIKKFFIAIYFLTGYEAANSQDRITTDRPDQTESAWLTPTHYFQGEFGFNWQDVNADSRSITFPDMLLKYGIAKRFELQLGGQYISVRQKISSSTETSAGLVPMELGFRVGLWEQKKILPKTSVIVRTGFPITASKDFRTDHLPGLILLAMENAFTEHIDVGYNVGTIWDGDSPNPLLFYSVSFGFDLGKRWDVFVEGFGVNQKDNTAVNSLDAGVGFYINDNMKLDAYYGNRVSLAADRNFFGIGYSFRLNTSK
jgi:hypothetical protein